MVRHFSHQSLPGRVLFGAGTRARLADELQRLGASRPLLIGTSGRGSLLKELAELIGGECAGLCDRAVMHTPVEVTEQALQQVQHSAADALVAVGGGSAIGLGKALALRTGLPQVVLPTTYSGSEVTPVVGETAAGLKQTQSSPKVLPAVVIYDVELTLALPASASICSGFNAMAHAVEASYAEAVSPLNELLATQGIALMASALPRIAARSDDLAARSDALQGAWYCGLCLSGGTMALHHKLCHVLGGSFGLPHAETHTVILPHVVAYNAAAAPTAMQLIAGALGADGAARGLRALAVRLHAPLSLKQLGMRESDLPRAVELALAQAYRNPRPLTREGLTGLLQNAYHGREPL